MKKLLEIIKRYAPFLLWATVTMILTIICFIFLPVLLLAEKTYKTIKSNFKTFNQDEKLTKYQIAEKLVEKHKDFKSEGFSEYMNGYFNGIIKGIEYTKKKNKIKSNL